MNFDLDEEEAEEGGDETKSTTKKKNKKKKKRMSNLFRKKLEISYKNNLILSTEEKFYFSSN